MKTVIILTNNNKIYITINNCKIYNIKEIINLIEHIPISNQILIYKNVLLNNNKYIFDYIINDNNNFNYEIKLYIKSKL